MAVYMIGYDLHPSEGEEHYDRLFKTLEVIGSGYWDCLESTWLVITEKTAAQIRDELRPCLRAEDRLLIMRYGEGAAWVGFKDDCQTWLEDYLEVAHSPRGIPHERGGGMRIPHDLHEEFPGEASLIERLARTSHDFNRLVTRYDEVNRSVYRIESEEEPAADDVVEALKKQRLKLKDEIAAMLVRTERRM